MRGVFTVFINFTYFKIRSAVFVVWEIRNPQNKRGSEAFAEIGKVWFRKVRRSVSAHPPARCGLILFHITAQADSESIRKYVFGILI